jgi:L-asparaginase / beta-aspartyl-peptidase
MQPSLIVHGGAGDLSDGDDPDGALAVAGCQAAARAGLAVLLGGGSALDAAVAAVVCLEDDPLFNAGTGSTLTIDGEVECDASLMAGDGRAGAVACVRTVRNPVRLARLVMERTGHVLLVGVGAEEFAVECGIERLPPGALITERVRDQWRAALARRTASRSNGTVGCVARDGQGRVAAATSTGGMMMKRRGRVGDSPLIGAGTYADDLAGAASCTGAGEAFIKAVAAKAAVDAMRAGAAPDEAARQTLAQVRRTGGEGGIICVDRHGQVGFAFDSARMTRAWIDADGGEGSGFRPA